MQAPLFSTQRIMPRSQWGTRDPAPETSVDEKAPMLPLGLEVQTSSRNKRVDAGKYLVSQDEVLQQHLKALHGLGQERRASALVKALHLGAQIKARLRHLYDTDFRKIKKSYEVKPSPPKNMYTSIIRRSGHNGLVTLCKSIITDMRDCGHNIHVHDLNHLLKAAILSGDEEEIHTTLQLIAELPSPRVMDRESEAVQAEHSRLTGASPLLSPDWTRNWTEETYSHLFLRCQMTHNAEFCLALLGAASQKTALPRSSSREPNQVQEASQSFLFKVLAPATMTAILVTLSGAREARLAADTALWMDEYIGTRRLSPLDWMYVLRVCSDVDWFPGMSLAWGRAVVQGMTTVDEGLLLAVILCASRSGEADFIKEALELWRKRATVNTATLQEWHLAPLLDAYCASFDFEGAIRTSTKIAQVQSGGNASGSHSDTSLESLMKAAGASGAMLEAAYDAFMRVGRDASPQGGVSVSALNALMKSANRLGRPDVVLKLYKSRQFVRNESSPSDSLLPPWSIEEDGEKDMRAATNDGVSSSSSSDEASAAVLDEDLIEDGHDQRRMLRASARFTVQASIDTFNILLSTAINRRSRRLAKAVMAHLVAARIPATAVTYERAIVLALTQPTYEAAFSYLEECKLRGHVPTRASYLAIAKRCLEEHDERWVGIGNEMIENGYKTGKVLHGALEKGGWLEQSPSHASPARQQQKYPSSFQAEKSANRRPRRASLVSLKPRSTAPPRTHRFPSMSSSRSASGTA